MAYDDDNQRPRGINNLNLRDDVTEDVPSELPEQMGGVGLPVLFPGTHIFRIPQTVAQLIETYDEVVKDQNGNAVADPSDPNKALLEPRVLVSDMAYLLRESLKYTGPLTKNSEWVAALQWAAGKVFRAEHGLSAY